MYLNNTGFFEDAVGAVLVDSLDGSGGESESDRFLEFWHVDAFLLEIRVLANKSSRIKLGGASAVGISTSYPRTLFIYGANSRHLRQLT